MLSQLKIVHAELRDAIAALEAVLAHPVPDDAAVAAARLRLSRISRQRRSLIECTILPLLHDLPPAAAAEIAELRLETARLLVQSSSHIGAWTMRAIMTDWAGYQRASAEMRRAMLRRIDREARLLYPLLEARAAAA